MFNSCTDHQICIDKALTNANKICHDNGLRFTKIRQKVLHIILQKLQPIKAYDILDILKKEDSTAKPATVYRALDFLLENRFIHKLYSLNSYIACYHPLNYHQCYFLICNKCNEVKEYCNADLTKELKKIDQNSNFKAENIMVEVHGICSSCNITREQN